MKFIIYSFACFFAGMAISVYIVKPLIPTIGVTQGGILFFLITIPVVVVLQKLYTKWEDQF